MTARPIPAPFQRGTPLEKAFRRGDVVEMSKQASILHGSAWDDLEQPVKNALALVSRGAIETRRQNVRMIGDAEAFVRTLPNGREIEQIGRAVTLSIDGGDLYQITKTTWMKASEAEAKGLTILDRGRSGKFADKVKVRVKMATPQMQALNKINSVVGLSVANPPTVFVDGKEQANPYIQRAPVSDDLSAGLPGDLMRIVVAVMVVGATPATGNMSGAQYVLDYEPGRDFQHALGQLATGKNKYGDDLGGGVKDHCLLVTAKRARKMIEARADDMSEDWAFFPLVGGVGYLHNLAHPAILDAYRDYTSLLQFATRKAQTVARRNAMLHHPALGSYRTILTDDNGEARISVIGWAGGAKAMAEYADVADRISRGIGLPENFEVIEADGKYDPDSDDHVPEEEDAAEQGIAQVRQQEEAPKARAKFNEDDTESSAEENYCNGCGYHFKECECSDDESKPPEVDEKRAALLAHIDGGIEHLTPEEARSLGYDPTSNTTEQLQAIKARLDKLMTEGL